MGLVPTPSGRGGRPLKALVTGATGHVGGAIAEHLAGLGHEVTGLARRLVPVRGVGRSVALDLGVPGAAERICAEGPFGAIVHAAADLSPDPHASAVSLVDCLGTQSVVTAAERLGARLVYTSSVPVIGVPRRVPVDESHPVDPPTAYHAAKLYGERLVELARRRGMVAASLRLTAPVGPRMPSARIMSVFVARAQAGEPLELRGRGTRRQDYVDVRDVASAVGLCLEHGATGLFNVASGRPVSNVELARLCVDLLGSRSDVVHVDRPDPEDGVVWEVSVERAAGSFGYAPAWSLEDSIRAVAEVPPRGLARATTRSPRRDELRKKTQ